MRDPSSERLRRFLRTPRGTVALLLAALCVATAVALAVTTQRDWFEDKARERYPPVTSELHTVGVGLDGERASATVRALSAEAQRGLYAAWMVEGARWPAAAPRAMLGASPDLFLACAEATLAAGSAAQRARAAHFLGASDHPRARSLLARELERARSRGKSELASAVTRELALASTFDPSKRHRREP